MLPGLYVGTLHVGNYSRGIDIGIERSIDFFRRWQINSIQLRRKKENFVFGFIFDFIFGFIFHLISFKCICGCHCCRC